jgi:uncharacterized membrane protein YqjE
LSFKNLSNFSWSSTLSLSVTTIFGAQLETIEIKLKNEINRNNFKNLIFIVIVLIVKKLLIPNLTSIYLSLFWRYWRYSGVIGVIGVILA